MIVQIQNWLKRRRENKEKDQLNFALEKFISGCWDINFFIISCFSISSLVGGPICFCLWSNIIFSTLLQSPDLNQTVCCSLAQLSECQSQAPLSDNTSTTASGPALSRAPIWTSDPRCSRSSRQAWQHWRTLHRWLVLVLWDQLSDGSSWFHRRRTVT